MALLARCHALEGQAAARGDGTPCWDAAEGLHTALAYGAASGHVGRSSSLTGRWYPLLRAAQGPGARFHRIRRGHQCWYEGSSFTRPWCTLLLLQSERRHAIAYISAINACGRPSSLTRRWAPCSVVAGSPCVELHFIRPNRQCMYGGRAASQGSGDQLRKTAARFSRQRMVSYVILFEGVLSGSSVR